LISNRLCKHSLYLLVALFGVASLSCRQQMADQPNYRPLVKSEFFADGRSARPAIPGTVARGQLHEDEQFYTGRVGGEAAQTFPFAVTREVLYRGQQRFDVFCSPCHDRVGNGQGMIVRRGFRPPPSLHIDRLREARPGYFFEVISRGFGTMPDYAEQIPPEDRWAIAAYIRALQLSQQAALTEVPEDEQRRLKERAP
jgi:mono/diheme cytochrome c family protein